MSYTWTQFKAAVQDMYGVGAKSTNREEAAIAAVASYVKAKLLVEVYSDLTGAKHYMNLYVQQKADLAGYTITSSTAAVTAAVVTLLTVDGVMQGMSAYRASIITKAINDFNGMATTFDNLLLVAAIELQRKVKCFRSNQRNTYDSDTSGVSSEGFVSKITLPDQSTTKAVYYGTKYEALAALTAYAVDDFVESNGRVYQCNTAGSTPADISTGLITTDGTDEILGTATFVFYGALDFNPCSPVKWESRQAMYQDETCLTYIFTVNPQGTELWVFPAMDSDHRVIVEWDGIKKSFASGDATTFDFSCVEYAAHFIRGSILQTLVEATQAAAVEMGMAQAALRRLYYECLSKS